jgi:hypothetical protein
MIPVLINQCSNASASVARSARPKAPKRPTR